jgi:hypothetical protein
MYGDLERPLDGTPGLGVEAEGRANPSLAQLGTMLFGGTPTDGTYSQVWVGPDGTSLTVAVVRDTGAPATNADLAAQLVVNASADDAWANVATFEVDGGTAEQVNITWLHPSTPYAIGATAAPAPGTLTPAITRNAGGNPVPVGRFLIAVTNDQDPDIPGRGLPLTTSTAADIVGFNLRDGSVENTAIPGVGEVEATRAGRMISSAFRGPVYATNHGTVATTERGQVHVVVNPAGGQQPGWARSDADGGNTVALDVADQAYWLEGGIQPGERGQIRMKGL